MAMTKAPKDKPYDEWTDEDVRELRSKSAYELSEYERNGLARRAKLEAWYPEQTYQERTQDFADARGDRYGRTTWESPEDLDAEEAQVRRDYEAAKREEARYPAMTAEEAGKPKGVRLGAGEKSPADRWLEQRLAGIEAAREELTAKVYGGAGAPRPIQERPTSPPPKEEGGSGFLDYPGTNFDD
jgi:hypothetical protein